MKFNILIDHIEDIHLRFEYPPERRFTYAGGVCDARVTSLVLVHTDTGHTGIGAGYTHPGLMHLIVKQQFEPLLVGEDPRETEKLWNLMYGISRWYGRKGAAMTALGALDTAFWASIRPSAVLQIGSLQLLVMTHPTYDHAYEQYASVGLDPRRAKFVGVKNIMNFRAGYRDIMKGCFVLDCPGPTPTDMRALPFRRVKRPVFPLDDDTRWEGKQ